MSNLELNKGDQFIVAADISASMQTGDCPNNTSRYNYMLEQMKVFIAAANEWDPGGVSIYLFGANVHAYPDVTQDKVDALIGNPRFEGMTMTHLAVQAAFKEHLDKKAASPTPADHQTFFIIFTDGEPADQSTLKKTIVDITNKVDDAKEFLIEFITVGNRTPSLDKFLTDLDNDLKGAKYDIVTVRKLEETDFNKAVSDAVMAA